MCITNRHKVKGILSIMDNYNQKYDQFIEPLYGVKRDIDVDTILLQENVLPHVYNVSERVDMTNYETYSIDPEGCEDADDAFSIYSKDDCLYLTIHIADPTEYINIDSTLWKDMETRIVTKYPSHKPPIHMMPTQIMEQSSLMVNRYGNLKRAISIVTEIDTETYKPTGKTQLLFTHVKVNVNNALCYKQAGEMAETNKTVSIGLKISEALQLVRGRKTMGIVLNEVSNSEPKYDDDGNLYLYSDTVNEIRMKQMIAEFAIFANSFVGEYLKLNFSGRGIFRACSASEWLTTVDSNITGQELLNEIITNGIASEYVASMKPHDLVGSPEYSHFTSPIRRISDCICHYLLKYIFLQQRTPELPVPFSNHQLDTYSKNCLSASKSVRNIQFRDKKFRVIQTIYSMLSNRKSVNISYFISCYTAPYLNLIIRNIHESSVYISYTLCVPDLQTDHIVKDIYNLDITRVKYIGKFDEGSLPELDNLFIAK